MAHIDSVITVPKDVLLRELDGEAVILNLVTGKYYGLDSTGTRMWNVLAQHQHVRPAFNALLDEFEVSPEQLEKDLLALIDQLVKQGLLGIEPPH
jgi:hypothetical protein